MQARMQAKIWHRAAIPASAATSSAPAALVPALRRRIPAQCGQMRLLGQPQRLTSDTGCDLEYVSILVDVMGDHVHNVESLHARSGQVVPAAARQLKPKRSFYKLPTEMTGPRARGRIFFAREVE